ncbi:monovalent cation/H+ antiporter complex subunit F [Propionibacteriaceae bacterium G1746]|uniref:monovalent cation/H+ antiporter complex subunit F n=1 Tax=Aestuariimicrobium sp. G57 TaxID=3418485 RepID=UPI003C1C8ED1
MSIAITIIHGIAMVLLVAAAGFALYRMAHGPTSLDRSVASDVIIAVLIAATGLYTVTSGNAFGMPVLVVLSLLGFTAAVGMARLISNRSDQVRTLHEARRHHEDGGHHD